MILENMTQAFLFFITLANRLIFVVNMVLILSLSIFSESVVFEML